MCIQYTTRKMGSALRVSLEANFARNASCGASRVSLWNQIASTELKNVPHENFAKQKCLSRGFRETRARYSPFVSSFTCCVLYVTTIPCIVLILWLFAWNLRSTRSDTTKSNLIKASWCNPCISRAWSQKVISEILGKMRFWIPKWSLQHCEPFFHAN